MITVSGQRHFTKEDFPPPPEGWSGNFVPGEGPVNAPILILGEAPGEREDKEGAPFVGPAGYMLRDLMRNAGIEREDCYITNVIKYRPPGNDITTLKSQTYVQKSLPALLKEIKKIRPRVIVPVGNVALTALGFNYKIGKARGSIIESPLGKIIPTYHPAFLFRKRTELFTVQKDWVKIKRHSQSMSITKFAENFELFPTIDDVETFVCFINGMIEAGQKVSLGIDIETYMVEQSSLLTPIKTIGFALTESKALVVPFINESHQYYWTSKNECLRAIKAVGSLLENPNITKILHNALFDVLVLMNHGWDVVGPFFDTMLGQYLVYHPSPHDLGYVVSTYTDYPPWKLAVEKGDRDFRAYNARDCIVLQIIKPDIEADINDNGLRTVFDIVMSEIKPTVKMMLNGIYVDQSRYITVKETLEGQMEYVRDKIIKEAGIEINLESNRQMANLLFKRLKLRSGVKTKGGVQSTGADVLKRLSLRYPNKEIINDIIHYRTLSTRYKTFIKNLFIQSDGRVHSNFQLHTAVTGRFSSRDPNLQNLPSRTDEEGYIRRMYVAPPGRVIVTADYSQLELMLFAVITEDPIWMDAFENGKDVHALNGDALLGKYNPKYRTFIKNFIYGLIYGSEGGEVEKVAPKELISKISVRQMMDNIKKTHPQMFIYRNKIEKQLETQRFVTNAFGRRRWYIDTVTKDDMRSAYNFPIQSTAGDIMHIKMAQLDEALRWPEEMIILQLHDAFYLEVPELQVDKCAGLMKEIMEEPVYSPMGYKFDLKVEVSIGKSLSSKEMEDWNGAR